MNWAESLLAFGGLQAAREEARVVVIPVAYDLTTTYAAGARDGPRALIDASTHMELFDEELGFAPIDVGVHTLPIVEQVAAGPEAMSLVVQGIVREALEDGKLPVLLGGDHSLSIGAFRALHDLGLSATILQLDAHADLREEYQGTAHSHACVMARARELFPCAQVGIRSLSEPEHERARRERLAILPARRLREDREAAVDEILPLLGRRIYLTLDLDVLDPSIMPATGTPEPGGLLWDEIQWVVRALTRDRSVIGFDMMELSPIPGLRAPEFLAAKLLNKILGIVWPPGGAGSIPPSAGETPTQGSRP